MWQNTLKKTDAQYYVRADSPQVFKEMELNICIAKEWLIGKRLVLNSLKLLL